MKNLYNQIEQNLKVGLIVVVKGLEDNNYCILSNLKNNKGNYRCSCWYDTIEKAKQYIVDCYGYSKECWNNLDLEIVEVYREEFEPFKVGDKVRILDSIKKTGNWEDIEEYFPNMTGEIKGVFFDTIGIHYSVNDCYIGHEYLAPLVEQEDNVALEAIKVLEEKGYKIVKK